MITFASFPTPPEHNGYDSTRRYPDEDDDMDVDFEGDDLEMSGRRLTSPGESLTSSHAFMRCVSSCSRIRLSTDLLIPVRQWTWYLR